MPSYDLRDATLDYQLQGGSGPLAVQLHGLMSCSRDARDSLDVGRALPGHRVLRYDARGHGGSTGPRSPMAYTWEHLAEDLVALLDHVAPDERVHGVGSSMGVGTLLHAAAGQAGRFASLTLITPPTAWETRPTQAAAYRVGAEFIERQGLAAFVEFRSANPTPPALAATAPGEPAVSEDLLPTILRGAALTDLPSVDVLAAIEVPTQILAWTDDPTHPLSTAQVLADVMPDSSLAIACTPEAVETWPALLRDHVCGCRAMRC